jgi:ribosomal protein S27E
MGAGSPHRRRKKPAPPVDLYCPACGHHRECHGDPALGVKCSGVTRTGGACDCLGHFIKKLCAT